MMGGGNVIDASINSTMARSVILRERTFLKSDDAH
jgi:hypothetical protein